MFGKNNMTNNEKDYEILNEYKDDYFIHGTNFIKEKNKFAQIYKKENEYTITDHIHGKKSVDGPEIIYRINKDGFRSQHFENFNKNKKNVLIAGCSISLGHGLPENITWHQEMLKQIKFDEYYNLSSMGASTRLIVKNILTFIRKNGKPEYIFVIFPNFGRDLQFDRDIDGFTSCVVNKLFVLSPKEYMTSSLYTKNYQYEYSVFTSIDYIRILEDICEYLNIKLIWSTWDTQSKYVFNKLKFKYYFNFNYDFSFYGKQTNFKITENINNLPYWEAAKDGDHPGSCWSMSAGKEFYSEFLRRGYD